MTTKDILGCRLINHQISGNHSRTPAELVSELGALQAQDYAMAKWALGCRLPGSNEDQIEMDFQGGKILRTHVLRPTWHFVAPQDIRWMLNLTGPRIKAFARLHHARLGIDSRLLQRSKKLMEKVLGDTGGMARDELQKKFAEAKINTAEARFGFLLLDAELDGLICSAGRRGRQFAYGLLEQIVPAHKSLTANEPLATLTQKYFASHGPATEQDFSWWSGLPLELIKKGLALVGSGLVSEKVGGQLYWFSPLSDRRTPAPKGIYFLPGFDEYCIGYKSRNLLADPASVKKIMSANGIFRPILVENGKITGLWKKTESKSQSLINLQLFPSASRSSFFSLSRAAGEYFNFLGKKGHLMIG